MTDARTGSRLQNETFAKAVATRWSRRLSDGHTHQNIFNWEMKYSHRCGFDNKTTVYRVEGHHKTEDFTLRFYGYISKHNGEWQGEATIWCDKFIHVRPRKQKDRVPEWVKIHNPTTQCIQYEALFTTDFPVCRMEYIALNFLSQYCNLWWHNLHGLPLPVKNHDARKGRQELPSGSSD